MLIEWEIPSCLFWPSREQPFAMGLIAISSTDLPARQSRLRQSARRNRVTRVSDLLKFNGPEGKGRRWRGLPVSCWGLGHASSYFWPGPPGRPL